MAIARARVSAHAAYHMNARSYRRDDGYLGADSRLSLDFRACCIRGEISPFGPSACFLCLVYPLHPYQANHRRVCCFVPFVPLLVACMASCDCFIARRVLLGGSRMERREGGNLNSYYELGEKEKEKEKEGGGSIHLTLI